MRNSQATRSLNGVWRFTLDPLDHGIRDSLELLPLDKELPRDAGVYSTFRNR